MASEQGGNAIERLLTVTRDLSPLPKRHEVDKKLGGWSYRGIDDVYGHVQERVATAGLISTRRTIEVTTEQVGTTQSGAPTFRTTLRMELILTAPDGSHVVTEGLGESTDHQRSYQQAFSQADKYAWLALLTLPVGDPDADETMQQVQGSGGAGARRSPTIARGAAPSSAAPPDVYLIEKLGVGDDGRWPQVCPACTAEVEQAQTRAGKDMWKCTNRDCEGGAADRLRDDGRRWWWTSFHEDPWKPGGEVDNLVRSAGGGTVENVTPDIDPERWLADAVEAFDQWTPEQRHEYGTQAMHELKLTRPLGEDDAAAVLRQMRAWYDAEFADDDERPF